MPESQSTVEQSVRQLAHDLRSPLSTIAMGIEAIRVLKDDPEQIENLCQLITEQGVESIKKILNDLQA